MAETNTNNTNNRKNYGAKVPGVCFNPAGKEPKLAVFDYSCDEVIKFIYDSAKNELGEGISQRDIIGIIVVNKDNYQYDSASKQNVPARTISFQVAMDASNSAIAGEFSSMLDVYLSEFSEGYRRFAKKFCNVKDDKFEKPLDTSYVDGKKIKVLFLNTDKVFGELIDYNSRVYGNYGGNPDERYDVHVKAVYKPEFLDKNGNINLTRSTRIEKVVDHFEVTKAIRKSSTSGFNGVYSPKKISIK